MSTEFEIELAAAAEDHEAQEAALEEEREDTFSCQQ